jgi:hypothetical protein
MLYYLDTVIVIYAVEGDPADNIQPGVVESIVSRL